MKWKVVSGLVLMLLLTSMIPPAFIIQPAKANGTNYTVKDGAEPNSTSTSSQRKLAMTSDGELNVVYHRKDANGILQIYHAQSADGGKTWTEEQITDAVEDQCFPALAVDSNDNLHLVWEYGPEGPEVVPYAYYRKKTTTWQAPELVASYAITPAIAVDSNDNVHVVYGTFVHYGEARGTRWRMRTSTGWQPEEIVSSINLRYQRYPAIAIDGNNDVHVVWDHAPGPNYDTHYRKRTSSGWGLESEIFSDSATSTEGSIAIDSENNVHVVVQYQLGSGGYSIKYREFTTSWQSVENLEGPTIYPQRFPSIAIDAKDQIHVVWSGQHSDSPAIYQLRYRSYVASWQPINELTFSTSNNQAYPSLFWALHPTVGGVRTNRQKESYSFIWMDGTTIKHWPRALSLRAAEIAIAIIGAKYQFGAGGYCYDRQIFVSKEDIIQNGYGWNPGARKQYGTGLDCSGLVFWSYNKATGNLRYGDSLVPRTANAQYEAAQPVIKSELKPGDLLFFDAYRDSYNGGYTLPGQDDHKDHVAMYVGDYQYSAIILGKTYSGTYNVVEATGIGAVLPQTVDSIIARIQGTYGKNAFVGYGRVIEQPAQVKMKFIKKSPIEMNVTDPEGFTITKDVNETEGMFYRKLDINGDGELENVICAWEKKQGDYFIDVAPQPGAAPTDTYTIEVQLDNITTVVAENVTVSSIPNQPYIVTANETTITPRLDAHDIGAKWITPSKMVVGQNLTLEVNATVFNYGQFAETFNVTLYANTTLLATFTNITLASRNSTTFPFTWNTAGSAKGNYSIIANVTQVPGETYTADNTETFGIVTVTVQGDVNGNRIVDAFDLYALGKSYSSSPGQPNWNSCCDINDDEFIDNYDLAIVGENHGQS